MPRKVTPTVSSEIRRRAAAGDSRRAIAAALGLSPTTVSTALAAVPGPKRPPAPLAPPEPAPELALEDEEPADLDTQLAWLSRVAGQRRLDADRLRRQGDDAGAARATSDALKAAALLARHTQRPEQAGRYVTDEQIAQAASECRNRLRTLIEHARAEKGTP